jgi:SNF2 family DNA or RNA helicase
VTYTPRLPPYAHQVEALRRLQGREEFALLMAMRTGKTKVTIDDFGRLWGDERKVDDMLVVAPAGAYRTWARPDPENPEGLYRHADPAMLERMSIFTWSAQETTRRSERDLQAFLTQLDDTRPRALLVNVESLSNVKRAQDLCLRFASQRRCYGVVDESTTIKNPTSKRTKFVARRLGGVLRYRRILSGLIAPQSPLDVYSQFDFLRPGLLGFTNFWSFRARYAVVIKQFFGGRSFDQIVGYRDEDELAERIRPHSYRVRLEDCYDVPEKVYQLREVRLTDEQARIYREMRDYATTKLASEAHVTATQVMVQMQRLHQILCGHVVDEQGVLHDVPEARTAELLTLLGEYAGKAIIWCAYDHSIRHVAKVLEEEYGKGSVARFWGGNKPTREAEERMFLNDDKCRFMVATAAAGGRGRTWTVADLVVYHSSTPNLEHRAQSEERAQGVDKSRPVLYVDLVAPGTVEMRYLKALRKKIDLAATINGDAWREWIV